MPRSPPGFMERFQGLSRSFRDRDRGDDSSSSECSTASDNILCAIRPSTLSSSATSIQHRCLKHAQALFSAKHCSGVCSLPLGVVTLWLSTCQALVWSVMVASALI